MFSCPGYTIFNQIFSRHVDQFHCNTGPPGATHYLSEQTWQMGEFFIRPRKVNLEPFFNVQISMFVDLYKLSKDLYC